MPKAEACFSSFLLNTRKFIQKRRKKIVSRVRCFFLQGFDILIPASLYVEHKLNCGQSVVEFLSGPETLNLVSLPTRPSSETTKSDGTIPRWSSKRNVAQLWSNIHHDKTLQNSAYPGKHIAFRRPESDNWEARCLTRRLSRRCRRKQLSLHNVIQSRISDLVIDACDLLHKYV